MYICIEGELELDSWTIHQGAGLGDLQGSFTRQLDDSLGVRQQKGTGKTTYFLGQF